MSDLPLCGECGHLADSHADRAVVGCVPFKVIDLSKGESWTSEITEYLVRSRRCPCNGYQPEVQSDDEHLQPGPEPGPTTLA